MKLILSKLYLLIILSFFLYSANVGDSILNKASISYTISGIEKNQTTNEVNNTIVATPATIEFLAYAPKGEEEIILQPTFYKKENNATAFIPLEMLDIIENQRNIRPPITIKAQPTSTYLENDLIIIKVKDIDRNINIDALDKISVKVTDPATNDIEELILTETTPNSGVFIGYIQATANASLKQDGVLTVASNSHITAIYKDNGQEKEVVAKARVAKLQFRLYVHKTQSKDSASLGEFVKYTIIVENISDIDYSDVLVEDTMSDGLEYQKGSFKVDSKEAKPDLSNNNMQLDYFIKELKAHQRVTLSYVALITPGIINNEVINKAYAMNEYAGVSNIAKTTLKIKEELYNSNGFIVGYVYDKNCTQKEGNNSKKCGVEGVRLYLEDGRYVITDKHGKYHFTHIKMGTHVLALDKESIRDRYKVVMCKDSVDFAKSPSSQFVDIYKASIKRANFCVEKLPQKVAKIELAMKAKKISANEIELNVTIDKNTHLENMDFVLSLSEGLEYIKESNSLKKEPIKDKGFLVFNLKPSDNNFSMGLRVKKGVKVSQEILGMLIFDSKVALDQKSKIAEIEIDINRKKPILTKPIDRVVTLIAGAKVDSKEDLYWVKPTKSQQMPKYTKEEVDALGDKSKIVWPPKGWVPSIPSTRVAVLFPKGHRVELKLNGKKVDSVHYEGMFRGKKSKMRVMHYKGIDLYEGKNVFVALIKKGKKVIKRLKRVVYVENHAPTEVKFLPKYSYLIADGKNPPVIAVKLIGASKHPLRGGLTGSFSSDKAHPPLEIVNDKGAYKVEENGIAYIKLKPTTKNGDVHIKIPLANGKQKELVVNLKPYMRKWILVGFAEGTVGYKIINGNKESLSKRGIKKGIYTDGEIAFFAKGQIKGKWLLTLAYDSRRKKDDRAFFDRIDPNKYYTIYQDKSTQGNDAPSRSKLYVKIENDKFFAMYGDFNPSFTKTKLASYSRDFTGFNSQYKNKNFTLKSFLAKSEELFFRDEFKGDGTRGYYYLKNNHILEGSEKVIIEVKDKNNNLHILSTKELQRDKDYEIDYEKGIIYFKDPIFSYDEKFNPIYVVVKYEVDANLKDSYSYGLRAEYKDDNESYTLGATFINEDRGDDRYRVYAVDSTVTISSNLSLKVELAQSSNTINGKNIKANASLAELNYKDDNLSATLFYRKQDDAFGLGQLSDSLSATRKIGLEVNKKVSNKLSFQGSIYHNRTYLEDNKEDSLVALSQIEYKAKEYKSSFGYKYTKTAGEDAEHDIVLTLQRDFWDNNLSTSFYYEQSLTSSDSKISGVLNYKYDTNTTIGFSLTRALEDGDISWSSALNISRQLDKNTLVEYSRHSSDSKIYDSFAISKDIIVNDKLKVALGFEKGLSSEKEDDYSSYSISTKYEDKNWSVELGADYKDAKDRKKINLTAGAYIKKSDEVALASRIDYHKEWGREEIKKDIDAKIGFVYRPLEENFIFLSRLDYIKEFTKEALGSKTITQKLISNSHLNWQIRDNWELSLHYGIKYVQDTIDKRKYSSVSDVFGIVNEFDINKKWSVGLQAALTHSYKAKSFDYSLGVFAKRVLFKNNNIIVGYNLTGFDDSDFNNKNFYHQGMYLKFRVKFNTSTLKGLAKEGLR